MRRLGALDSPDDRSRAGNESSTCVLEGERLYIDIIYYYGPIAPYVNAFLYKIFGINLSTLHASGIACAALIVLMVYRLARHLVDPWGAALAAQLVVVTCAFDSNLGNYVQPYAYAALYGWMFGLLTLWCVVRNLASRRSYWIFWAGHLRRVNHQLQT